MKRKDGKKIMTSRKSSTHGTGTGTGTGALPHPALSLSLSQPKTRPMQARDVRRRGRWWTDGSEYDSTSRQPGSAYYFTGDPAASDDSAFSICPSRAQTAVVDIIDSPCAFCPSNDRPALLSLTALLKACRPMGCKSLHAKRTTTPYREMQRHIEHRNRGTRQTLVR